MASIGYNKGYYSRSKYNDLAFQAEATISATSGATARNTVSGVATIQANSNLTGFGRIQFQQSATIQATTKSTSSRTQKEMFSSTYRRVFLDPRSTSWTPTSRSVRNIQWYISESWTLKVISSSSKEREPTMKLVLQ